MNKDESDDNMSEGETEQQSMLRLAQQRKLTSENIIQANITAISQNLH